MRRTQVLVADPVAVFRAGLGNLLNREGDFEVIEAASYDEVVAAVCQGCPSIALIDLDLPPHGGVAAIKYLAERCSTHLVAWSFECKPEDMLEAIRAGASGCLHKEITPAGLVRCLRGIVRGEAPITRHLAALLIEAVQTLDRRDRIRERAALLSVRECEVLELVARGARNKQIAAALTISEFTAKRHVQNILRKLELPTRHAAASFFRAAFDATAQPTAGEAA